MSSDLESLLNRQKAAQLRDGVPNAAVRRNRIDRLIDTVLSNADALVEALRLDFGHRSRVQSVLTDVLGIIPAMKSDAQHVAEWMKPSRVSSIMMSLSGSQARVEWVPRGVAGIIAPWNFPVGLALQPLAQAFAAGNRAMLKLSEFTPRTSDLLQKMIADNFASEEAVVITGGPEVGAAFSALPFDIMFFTGATNVARHVQRACAENLVPCVLELGGKSPVVIGPNADLKKAAARIAIGKTLNAGQICLSPDYVFVPEDMEKVFVDEMVTAITKMFPTLLNNDDYTSIVAQRHYDRLRSHLDDAIAKGARIIEINPAAEDFSHQTAFKIPPALVLDANPQMTILQDEIFGPLLPIMTYQNIDQVIDYVNDRPRPLATYYFGDEDAICRRYLDRTISGGITLNDVLLHCGNENLPFGGVGDSGMGYYHGRAGFETFSHPRAIFSAPRRFSMNSLMAPPFGPRRRKLLAWYMNHERKAVKKRLEQNRV